MKALFKFILDFNYILHVNKLTKGYRIFLKELFEPCLQNLLEISEVFVLFFLSVLFLDFFSGLFQSSNVYNSEEIHHSVYNDC